MPCGLKDLLTSCTNLVQEMKELTSFDNFFSILLSFLSSYMRSELPYNFGGTSGKSTNGDLHTISLIFIRYKSSQLTVK